MTSTDLENRAKEAFIDDHFDLAVDLYSQAITAAPEKAELYADRSQANIKLSNFTGAVSDATKAIELDPSMAKAYLRKGTACIKLHDYATAKAALEKGADISPADSRFSTLIKQCVEHLPKETVNKPVVSSVLNSKPKYRHEFYQKPDEAVVTIFAKKVPSENVTVEYGEQILSVTIDLPGEEAYTFQPRLFGKIVPEKCRYNVLSTKVEIRLAKIEPVQWNSLEYCSGSLVPLVSAVQQQRPAYPSYKAKKDWDKIEAEVKKEEKEEKLDGDAGVNKFFREIYKDADEDARRAMMKSYVESNGTVLSTNWSEVGEKKVEATAPEGMKLKKWEY